MTKEFGFEASSDGEASTLASQQAIAIARHAKVDPRFARVVSTKRTSGNHYVAVISMPDPPIKPGTQGAV
jgi:hypothetical protein